MNLDGGVDSVVSEADLTALTTGENKLFKCAAKHIPVKFDKFGAKIDKVCTVLRQIKIRDPNAKAIVFVQWEDLAYKIAASFRHYGFNFLQLKGSANAQNKVIKAF